MRLSDYQNNTLAPSACPLPTDKRNPISLPPQTRSYRYTGIHLDAHAKIQLETGRGNLQRSSNVSLGKGMKQVVGGDGIFHDTEVGGTLQQVLALTAGVFGADLLAVDALHGQTLWIASQVIIITTLPR